MAAVEKATAAVLAAANPAAAALPTAFADLLREARSLSAAAQAFRRVPSDLAPIFIIRSYVLLFAKLCLHLLCIGLDSVRQVV